MTIDDNSSIYVGGLPYDISEESLRRVFYIYGAVLAVKIINDRSVGGKCYGFVTFANPRSATQAIREMDGKTIDGRVVKVNEVRTRGGRPNFNRNSSRPDLDRGIDPDSGRDRGRGDNYDRQRNQEGHRDRSQEHERYRERGHDRARDRDVDEERIRDYDRNMDVVEQEPGRKRDRDWERDSGKNVEQQRKNSHHKSVDKDKHQQLHLPSRSRFDDLGSRELSLGSFNDDIDQGESKLAVSNQKLEELRKEISRMEELVTDKQEVVSKLQEKYQKLEDSLISAKKLASHRHAQLARLHKCYLQMRDYDERFKKSEQELQRLLETTMIELGNDGGGLVLDS
ncbi:putative splicing factor, SR protein superfamily [Handroanthus impetiginosus]|uniref:Putative splicing factor, SR protein superfamily n=1 Tax=Handroanthus impetiginosus TaxID=429701 RepID=A0A2G9GFU4_9LAMI|nr:putative splicing factor, SR protein superfamily [Handroanthus impetiginosus]